MEVFEWRKENPKNDFLEALKRIKINKIVDPQLTLVCYIRKSVLIPPAMELNNQLKKINPKVKDIWYLGNVTPDSKTWKVTQIYPNPLAIDLDYDKILTTLEQHSFIHTYLGKSQGVNYEPTDKKVELTPEFEITISDKE